MCEELRPAVPRPCVEQRLPSRANQNHWSKERPPTDCTGEGPQLDSGIDTIVHIESLMSCHLLLNLLHELANMILCEALPSIISFLPTNVIKLVINYNEFEILFIT